MGSTRCQQGREGHVGIVQFAYRPLVAPGQGGELLVGLRSHARDIRGVNFPVELSGTPLMRNKVQVAPDTSYTLVVPVPEGVAGNAEAILEPVDELAGGWLLLVMIGALVLVAEWLVWIRLN